MSPNILSFWGILSSVFFHRTKKKKKSPPPKRQTHYLLVFIQIIFTRCCAVGRLPPPGSSLQKITCRDRSHNAEVTLFRKEITKKKKNKEQRTVFLSAPPAKCVEAKTKTGPNNETSQPTCRARSLKV